MLKKEMEQRQAIEMLCTDMLVPKDHLLRKIALVNKNWTEQVAKPSIKRSAITLQTPSLTEP